MPVLFVAALPLPVGGCFTELLEGPYVLATGLGPAATLSHTADGTLLVGGETGLWSVDGQGHAVHLLTEAVDSVSASPSRIFVLQGSTLRQAPWPPAPVLALSAGIEASGALQVQAWCQDQVMITRAGGLSLMDPGDGTQQPFGPPLAGARGGILGPDPDCASAVVLTDDTLLRVRATTVEPLLEGAIAPRTAAVDEQGRIWLVNGEPPVLSLVADGTAVTVARYLGQPRALNFGSGGLLHPQDAYIACADGSLDYVRVPAPGEGQAQPR